MHICLFLNKINITSATQVKITFYCAQNVNSSTLNTKITFIFTNDYIFPIFESIQKSLKIVIFEICNILSKKNFFPKNFFFNNFSRLISKIFSEIFFFSRFEFQSSDVFQAIFRKNTFLNIFLNIKSRNVRFSQNMSFLMLFKKK